MSQEAVRVEIERLHRFFEEWFRDGEGRSISEFADGLDSNFFVVSPSGGTMNRSAIVERVNELRGEETVDIRIESVELRHDVDGFLVATYEEHQMRGNESTVRVSTVGLVVDATTPGGYRWIFVHESWLKPRD